MKKLWLAFLAAAVLSMSGCQKTEQNPTVAVPETSRVTPAEEEPENDANRPTAPSGEISSTIAPFPTQEVQKQVKTEKGPGTLGPCVIVGTDLHYLAKELTDFGDAFTNAAKADDGKAIDYVWEITDAFLAEVIAKKPQALILLGDLTKNGELASHEALAEKLRGVEAAGIDVLVIPGNHDINNSHAVYYKGKSFYPAQTTTPEAFERIYADFGYREAISKDPHSLSYLYELPNGNRMLMLDSCQYEKANKDGGMIRQESYEWIEQALELCVEQDHPVVAAAHHNLLDESRIYEKDCTIEHSEELEEMLESWGINLFLSGHLHVQHSREDEYYSIREIVTSALSIYPCQYGILDFRDYEDYTYSVSRTNVTAWAEKKEIPDPNLQDFDAYANEVLADYFYRLAETDLKKVGIPADEIPEMADLYVMANIYAVEGCAVEIKDWIEKMDVLQKWKDIERQSVHAAYLMEILEDAETDFREISYEE